MDNILLYYSFINLIFLFSVSVGSRKTYSSSFACDIGCCPRRFVYSRRILDCLPFILFTAWYYRLFFINFIFFLCIKRSYCKFYFNMVLAPLRNYF
nr:MAG TPA: hypothetical protein [Caudoviricetes sp.]